MAGAGVLAMAHAGKHRSKMAIEASNWILGRDFTKFNHEPKCQCDWQDDRYNYGVFLCTQAMYQQAKRKTKTALGRQNRRTENLATATQPRCACCP